MEEDSIVLNVDFESADSAEVFAYEVQVVPVTIAWEDLELMVCHGMRCRLIYGYTAFISTASTVTHCGRCRPIIDFAPCIEIRVRCVYVVESLRTM